MATIKPDITGNPRVGPGSALFPESPILDYVSYVPNDNGFPRSPLIEKFVPGENGEFDEYIAGKPTPDSPADFAENHANRAQEHRDGSEPTDSTALQDANS
tara:strand:- start:52 stop:354 length:303 start_codon:yes stop_codon:yes gene_type:complete